MTRGHFESIMDDMMSDKDWKQLAELLGKHLKAKDEQIEKMKCCENCNIKNTKCFVGEIKDCNDYSKWESK